MKKKSAARAGAISASSLTIDHIARYVKVRSGVPRTDWPGVSKYVARLAGKHDSTAVWDQVGVLWLQKIGQILGSSYRVHESDNFRLLTNESDRYVASLFKFLERALKRIQLELQGIVQAKQGAKRLAVIISDLDKYHAYVGNFYPEEGEFGLSGGMFIADGCGHFAFPHQELLHAEPVSAHELTHACLSHLPISLWLNEGIAVAMEDIIAHSYPLRMDREMFERHKSFWGEAEVQQFWSGDSFYRSDQGQELSYHLARFAVQALSHDYPSFKAFVLSAHHRDGGGAAARKVYGAGLHGLLEQLLGPGDWTPKPKTWPNKKRATNSSL